MKIKEFVEQYNNLGSESLKDDFLRENLIIKKYLPYINKVSLAERIIQTTCINKETNEIKINSPANSLLFTRVIIEEYTNLEIETEGFFEEYDLLNASGLLEKIFKLIPSNESDEFKAICKMVQQDLITNKYEIHNYISEQVERFGKLIGITSKPILEEISNKLDNMTEKDIKKVSKSLRKFVNK